MARRRGTVPDASSVKTDDSTADLKTVGQAAEETQSSAEGGVPSRRERHGRFAALRRGLRWAVLGLRVFVVVVAAVALFTAVALLLDLSHSVTGVSACALQAWSRHAPGRSAPLRLLDCQAPESPPDWYDPAAPVKGSETVEVEVNGHDLKVTYDLAVPKGHRVVERVQHGEGREHPEALAELLGLVLIDDRLPEFEPPTVEVQQVLDTAHVLLASRSVSLPPGQASTEVFVDGRSVSLPAGQHALVLQPSRDPSITPQRVTVHGPPAVVSVGPGSAKPVAMSASDATFIQRSGSPSVALVIAGQQRTTPAASSESSDASLAMLLRRAAQLDVPVLWVVSFGLLAALPLLVWRRRVRDAADAGGDQVWRERLVVTVLWLHFAVVTALLLNEPLLTRHLPDVATRLLQRAPWWGRPGPANLDSAFPAATDVVMLLLLGALVPFVVQHRWLGPPTTSQAARRWRGFGGYAALVLGPLALLLAGFLPPVLRDAPRFDAQFLDAKFIDEQFIDAASILRTVRAILAPRLAVLVVVLFAAIILLLALTAGLRWRTAALGALLAVPVAVELALLGGLWGREGSLVRTVSIVALFVVAFRCLAALAQPLAGIARHDEGLGWTGWQERWWKLVAVVVLAALALPYGILFAADQRLTWYYSFSLAYAVDGLLWLVVLGYVLGQLRQDSVENEAVLQPAALSLGVLLALLAFFDSRARFVYVPVLFIVGWALVSRWLLRPEDSKAMQEALAAGASRRNLVNAVLELRSEQQSLEDARRQAKTASSKGELTPAQRDERVAGAEQALERLTAKQRERFSGHTADEFGLTLGPRPSPWESGKWCAACSLGFALVWLVLYVRARANDPYGPFPAVSLLATMTRQVAGWILYGFFFGYFFTAIRGRNGVEKGLALFAAVVIPKACLTALLAPSGDSSWKAFGLWAAELFIQSMLLGLVAGDIGTLLSVKLPWRKIFDVHDLRWLTGWASSLALAAGGAITALLTGALGELVRQTVQYATNFASLKTGTGQGP